MFFVFEQGVAKRRKGGHTLTPFRRSFQKKALVKFFSQERSARKSWALLWKVLDRNQLWQSSMIWSMRCPWWWWYIYNGEVYVCYEKAPFRTQRIWSFHTFIATFRTQRNWSFPCFLTHSVLKGIGRFHVSWRFPYSKDLVVSDVYSYIPYSKDLVVSMFLDTFVVKGFGRFSCL